MPQSLNNMSPVGRRWRTLIGSPSEFGLEARIFHSISLGLSVLAIVYIFYDLFAGMYIAAISSFLLGSIFLNEYYRSRFLLKPHRSLMFGIVGIVIMSINYFANAGIAGSTDIIWPAYLLLLLTICRYRHIITWGVIYIIVFGFVHVAEYQFPQWVQYPFRPGDGQFTDRITAFPLPVITIAVVVGLFRRNYDKERATVVQRDAEKSRLLSILSHDLRSPFIQIQQYLTLLEDDALTASERTRVEKTLKHNNEQTLHLVTNLLYWSRSQLDGPSVKLTQLPLHETLQSTLEMANSLSGEKGILVTARIDPGIVVIADADILQLVVRNLLQNAIKFTNPGGKISLNAETDNDTCSISIRDSGTGISKAQMETIFSGTSSSLGTSNEKGFGLGLQLCKEFMESQNGSIRVESELNKGSTFIVTLPTA